MSNWFPGAFAIIIILFLGLVIPFIVSGVVTLDSIEPDGLMNDTINIIDDGYNFTINIPILPDVAGTLPSPVPSVMRDDLSDRLTYMSLIPSVILFPLLVLCFLGLMWSIVKLVIP